MSCRPFLAWMGSKRLLTKQLLLRVPATYGAYHEPFLGSGAMLYALQPAKAFASDELGPVIELHKAVACCVDNVCSAYAELAGGCDRRSTFLEIRARFPTIQPHEFLFLMKNCHGSRFRVNMAGRFNSPFNNSSLKAATPTDRSVAADVAAMRQVASYSHCVDFARADYTERLRLVKPGDLLFLDPPYQWQDDKESDYGRRWGAAGWKNLAAALAALPRGVFIMLTLHGSMPRPEAEALLAGIPDIHLEAVPLTGSHLKHGGVETRTDWLARNFI